MGGLCVGVEQRCSYFIHLTRGKELKIETKRMQDMKRLYSSNTAGFSADIAKLEVRSF